ncbi:MAG: hydrolase [Clostridia bacterium BRH_c25]|nr:MAG: hydrolase [Clostridia bacterium BRH_c25]
MKFLVDTHCHTISSGHAYSTISEIAEIAGEKGLKLIAMTDHGPAMPGGPHIFHIGNQRIIPDYIKGVRVLKGVEANIMDCDGGLDLPDNYLKKLEIVIASFHDVCISPGSVEENTRALVSAMRNPYVDIIAHPGNPYYPIDVDRLIQCAYDTGKLIEINNSSFIGSRRGSAENCRNIAAKAKEKGVVLTAGSDCHICYDVGKFNKVEEIFRKIAMPEELIINTDPQKLIDYLNKRGRKVNL